MPQSLVSVTLSAVGNPHDCDDEFIAVDSVEDSVSAFPDTVLLVAREFFMPWRPMIAGEPVNSFDDSESVSLRDGLDFLADDGLMKSL